MKRMVLYLLSFLILLCVAVVLFLNFNPSFGGSLTKAQKKAYSQFDNYVQGKFVNSIPTRSFINSSNSKVEDREVEETSKDRRPTEQIPVERINWNKIKSEGDSFTWLGHSAFLISIDNKKILLDPMLSSIASPVSFTGVKRYEYSEDMINIIDEMPLIDAVLISHDHYDHLDYQSIIKLKGKVSHFFVPLGVSNHLVRWGISEDKITELNWWDENSYQGLIFALSPSRHFSGRGVFNRNTTLWGGWIIVGKNIRLYSSGDGGYGPQFEEIGSKYGPFDITLIEGAQYDKHWADIHMTPEQAVQANLDVNGKNMMLMHWGAFTLANHGWKEPIERAQESAKEKDVNLIIPKIGETVILELDEQSPVSSWWDF